MGQKPFAVVCRSGNAICRQWEGQEDISLASIELFPVPSLHTWRLEAIWRSREILGRGHACRGARILSESVCPGGDTEMMQGGSTNPPTEAWASARVLGQKRPFCRVGVGS